MEIRLCSVEGCGRVHYAKDLCQLHYGRVLRTGSTELPEPNKAKVCTVEGCEKYIHAKDMCQAHYRMFKKYGTVNPDPSLLEKPGPKTNRLKPATSGKGRAYAHLEIGGYCTNGHLLTEENTFKSPKSGYLRCGVCRTNATRRYRGIPEVEELSVANKHKTHCPQGHEYSEENTGLRSDGTRYCRMCLRARKSREGNRNRIYVSSADKKAMIEAQGGKCAICGSVLDGGRRTHVDHYHFDGTIRGILCNDCNLGIGHFKDSPTLLIKAAEYLMESDAFEVNADILAEVVKTRSTDYPEE